MVKLRRIVVVLLVLFVFSSVAYAENRTAKEYMAERIRAAYDNMHLIYQGFYDENGELKEQTGGYVGIWQEWDGDQLISRTFLDENCEPIDSPCVFWHIEFGEDGWSEWMEPEPDTENYCFTIGYADLGDKAVGDVFGCEVEIEFADVEGSDRKDFKFLTQGAVDGSWAIQNIWNGEMIFLREVPASHIEACTYTSTLNDEMTQSRTFELGFRCDNWHSGRFRMRNVKITRKE